jgi:hypothetical protein
MCIWLSNLRTGCLIVAVLGWCLLPCDAQTRRRSRGRSIEFSVPRGDEDTNSLQQMTIKKNGLKELGDDLYKTLPNFTPQSSLDGVSAPLPPNATPSATQSKRLKELLERRRNWVFMSPEDLLAVPSLEEILNASEFGADGRPKKQAPTLEQYYDRIVTKRSTAFRTDQWKDDELFGSKKKSGSRDETAEQDDSDLPSSVKDSAQALKRLFEPDAVGEASAQGVTSGRFADPFGRSDNTLTKEQVLAHRKLMDEYRSVVDSSWQPPAALSSFDKAWSLPVATQPMKSPSAGLSSLPTTAPHTGLDAQMDVLNPNLGPQGLPDINARALGQKRPPLPPPPAEAPKVVAPTFAVPKRAF